MTVWQAIATYLLEMQMMHVGQRCGAHDCCDVASWHVPWPGRGAGPRCSRHMIASVKIAEALGFDLAGITPLEVVTINAPDEDPSALRFAAMELT